MNSRYQSTMASLGAWWQHLGVVAGSHRGQGLAEYALILALIAIIAIVALIFLGNQVSSVLSKVGKSI
jgi:Flp pilus assembly pilin Flp